MSKVATLISRNAAQVLRLTKTGVTAGLSHRHIELSTRKRICWCSTSLST